MVGASSSAARSRAEVSAAAEAMMASAVAWSAEEGAGAPMVCQLFFLVLRNSALPAWTMVVPGQFCS